MEERKTIFDYIGQAFMTFGFTMLILLGFTFLFGEGAKEYSTIFSLGKEGIGADTMAQFLLAAVVTVALRALFFTDMLFRNMRIVVRTIGMVLSELVVIIIMVRIFGWFPMDDYLPWMMFFASFGICFAVSLAVTVCRERMENKRMEEALERLREKREER